MAASPGIHMDQLSSRRISPKIPFWLKLISSSCSAMISILEPVLRFFMGFYGNLLDLADRYPSDSRLESYLKSCQGSADLKHVVFYCSSAGEYEQAV